MSASSRHEMQKRVGQSAAGKSADDRTLLQFTISREKLNEAIAAVAPAVKGSSVFPALMNFHVEATDRGTIRFTATDLDFWLHHEVAADVDVPGAMTVPAKRLQAIGKELPPAPVRIRASANGPASIDCGKSRIKLLGQPVEDYPTEVTMDFSNAWTLPAGELHGMLARSIFAVSTEQSRPILNGVLVEVGPGTVRFVATNGHRLARLTREVESARHAAPVIVPPKPLSQLRRLFSDDQEIEFARGENTIAFRSSTSQITTRLIEGPYPNYDQVIPAPGHPNARDLVVDRIALISSIKRMYPVANDESHRLAMKLTASTLELLAQTPDVGEGRDSIPHKGLTGEPMQVGFNANYLLEILNAVSGDDVRLSLTAPERAVVFTPAEPTPGNDHLFLCMPLRLLD